MCSGASGGQRFRVYRVALFLLPIIPMYADAYMEKLCVDFLHNRNPKPP